MQIYLNCKTFFCFYLYNMPFLLFGSILGYINYLFICICGILNLPFKFLEKNIYLVKMK